MSNGGEVIVHPFQMVGSTQNCLYSIKHQRWQVLSSGIPPQVSPVCFGQHTQDSAFNPPCLLRHLHNIKALTWEVPTLLPKLEYIFSLNSILFLTQGYSLINDIKLEYLCHNKLPGIIFVLMHGDDYVINASLIRQGVQRWLMERYCKRSNQVVVGGGVNLKCKVDDQTIVDNCKISRMKIRFIESINGSFPR